MGILPVKRGITKEVTIIAKDDFQKVITNQKIDLNKIEKQVNLPELLDAPIEKNQKVGEIIYTCDGVELGKVDLITKEEVPKAKYIDYLNQLYKRYF